jgi:hypothetical protein
MFKPLVASIGRPSMGTHDLRHTFASQALSQGVSLKALQTILGHSDASLTLNRYSHLIPSDGQVAAEKMADLLLHEEPSAMKGHPSVSPVIIKVASTLSLQEDDTICRRTAHSITSSRVPFLRNDGGARRD